MEIFEGLEIIINMIIELIYNKAFYKKKNLTKRIPYIALYSFLLSLIIIGLIYLIIILFKNEYIILSISLTLIVILLLYLLIKPFFK